MFRRKAGGGSVYWFAARDKTGAFLDGNKLYRLTMPQPVPAKLFWSVTVYDPDTRSEIQTDQGKVALRSLLHALLRCICLLLEVKQTWLFALQMSAKDPERRFLNRVGRLDRIAQAPSQRASLSHTILGHKPRSEHEAA